jgi:hypothetical protein
VIKPGWRRIRKLRGGKELTQEENGEGVLDGFMLKQRVRRNGRIQPTVMKNGRGWPGGRQRVRIRGLAACVHAQAGGATAARAWRRWTDGGVQRAA